MAGKKVMILSGAGLSAESGLKTFRDNGGLWEEYDVMEVCSVEGFAKDPQKVRQFYDKRRTELAKVKPNYAHEKIAELKKEFGDRLLIFTQNVDDLLERAGCEDVIHLHGFLPQLSCSECGAKFYIGYEIQKDTQCKKCKKEALRHDIVMFGEFAPEYETLDLALDETELFVCIGTSGSVLPVGRFARRCEQSILNNLDFNEYLNQFFDKIYTQEASKAIDKIALDIRTYFNA